MNGHKRLFGLRGACQCLNEEKDISRQVVELYDELLRRNQLPEADIVSIIFSVTDDLDAKNPAAALRQGGRAGEASLFAVQEARIRGGLERTVRILVHCYLDEDQEIAHVYRNGAEVLRPDRK
ncbi:chorismate mutase [Leadbettera azotonutricia]|uniref:chorismate mutase n=1 Tax=Leadbettera azotonutricia (strain ATCC BAA-888 / DSM 13862 / ZAS-9) TaxID=545695 RepID=F5YDH5_LEAAZ|nr:chorismate mutase [Leadbettera azotonutricia]AEF81458.1 chorismate mutase [Leadbettera azotonutricia ZAS-9]